MTYSYSSEPLTYGGVKNSPVMYDGMTKQIPSSIPYAAAGLILGAAGGGFAGYKRNPFINKNGEAADSFTSSVYEKYVNKANDSIRKPYEQGKEILKKLDSIKTPEDLKALFDSNKEAAEKICSNLEKPYNEFLSGVDKDNINENKKTIKKNIQTANNTRYQDMKNSIKKFWDTEKKKFVKNDSGDKAVFNAINEAKKSLKSKIIAKYATIGGLGLGTTAFAAHKIILFRNANKETVQK